MTLSETRQTTCQCMILFVLRQWDVVSQIEYNLIQMGFRKMSSPCEFEIYFVLMRENNTSHTTQLAQDNPRTMST